MVWLVIECLVKVLDIVKHFVCVFNLLLDPRHYTVFIAHLLVDVQPLVA